MPVQKDFITPPGHSGFLAKELFRLEAPAQRELQWCALAYIQPGGGGPAGDHTHESGHIFLVMQGQVRVMLDGTPHTVREDESFSVPGGVPHSIWNDGETTAKVIKINVR